MFTASYTEGEKKTRAIVSLYTFNPKRTFIIFVLFLNWKCLSLIQACVHKPPSLDIIHCL